MKIYLLSLFTVMLLGCCTMPKVPLAAPHTDVNDKSTASLAGGKNAPTQAGLPTINSGADDVSADKLELRGGLWHVKGETKPFTGKVTLWTPGRGNEIARQVVKTYVNGKEQGSKVHILIGKRAPIPNR